MKKQITSNTHPNHKRWREVTYWGGIQLDCFIKRDPKGKFWIVRQRPEGTVPSWPLSVSRPGWCEKLEQVSAAKAAATVIRNNAPLLAPDIRVVMR
jgi:hypothetical protein